MSTRLRYIAAMMLVLFFVSCSGRRQKNDCTLFKNGKFIYRKNIPDSALFLTRDGHIQSETDKANSFLRRDSIVWKNECEYELYYLLREPLYPPDLPEERRAFSDEIRMKPSHIKIIKANPDYCLFEMRKENIDFVYSDTMWLVK